MVQNLIPYPIPLSGPKLYLRWILLNGSKFLSLFGFVEWSETLSSLDFVELSEIPFPYSISLNAPVHESSLDSTERSGFSFPI